MSKQVDGPTGAAGGSGTEEAPVKSRREEMMEQIEDRHEKFVADQQLQNQQDAGRQMATQDEDGAVFVDNPSRFRMRVKVGDKEEERSLDAVLNELQSSNGRVRALSKRENELAAELAEQKRLNEQLAAQGVGGGEAAVDDAVFAEMSRALIEGDEDLTKDLLKKFLPGRQGATPEEIARQVKEDLHREEAARKAEEDDEKVWNEFATEFPEFARADEKAAPTEAQEYGDFVYARDYAKRVDAGEISYREALRETAEKVRKVVRVETPTPPTVDPMEERRRRKEQTVDNLRTASGAVRGRQGDDDQDESHSDILEEMRRKRGLA